MSALQTPNWKASYQVWDLKKIFMSDHWRQLTGRYFSHFGSSSAEVGVHPRGVSAFPGHPCRYENTGRERNGHDADHTSGKL